MNLPFVKFELGRKRIHVPAVIADRGELRFVKGDVGIADKMSYGRLDDAGVPEWVDLFSLSLLSGGVPSAAMGSNAGVGATASWGASSGSRVGRLVIVSGTAPLAAGLIATVTTGEVLPNSSFGVMLSSADSDAPVPDFFFDFGSRTTTTWQLHSRSALAAGTSYHLGYEVLPFESAGLPGHSHPDQHAAATVLDTPSVDLTLTGQQISAAVNFGTTAGTAAQGNDTRLSDARTPTAHTHTAADLIGAAANLNIMLDGGGSVIQTGVVGDIQVPAGFNVVGWDLVADQVGSIVVDVWKDTYGVFPPPWPTRSRGQRSPRSRGC